ncbi:MAG: TPM domain-containing protein [Eubacteriales bacterium]|nr:TPM domain-containing protein [Eubacteriales bacterium]
MLKNNKIKYYIIIIFIIIYSNIAFSESIQNIISNTQLNNDVVVYDYANILNSNSENEINELINSIRDYDNGFELVVVTNNERGNSFEQDATKIFNSIGIGKKDRGILLYITIDSPHVRMEIGRGLEGEINDAKAGRILDTYFVPYRAQNDYDNATTQTVNAIYKLLVDGDVELIDNNENDMFSTKEIVIFLVLLIIIIILSRNKGSKKGGSSFFDNMSPFIWGSGFGGSFHGGMGSSHSFGGGMSSGGGASR